MTARAESLERALSRLVAEKAAEQASGLLTALRGKHKRLFCFDRGDLVFAASNMLEEQFVEHLRDRGWVTGAQFEEARKSAAESGVQPLALILQKKLVAPGDLESAMTSYCRYLLSATLQWPDGSFEFADGKPDLDRSITGSMKITGFILGHVMNYPADLGKVKVRIGPPDLVIETGRSVPEGDAGGLNRLHLVLLERCAEPADLSALIAESPERTEEIYRAVYGMLLTGLLRPSAREAADEQAPMVSRDEALAWLGKEGRESHYGILGISDEATREQIREAYYTLARKMHPDRFRSGPLQDLLPRVDSYFTYVTEAYNTLYDPERRMEYDRQLAEGAGRKGGAEPTDTHYVARQNLIRGRELAARKKYTEAVGFLENALNLDGANVEVLTELGRVLSLNPRRRNEAEQHLRRAVDLDPSFAASHLALAELCIRTERLEEAQSLCRKVLDWEAGNADAGRLLEELEKGGGREGRFRGLFGS